MRFGSNESCALSQHAVSPFFYPWASGSGSLIFIPPYSCFAGASTMGADGIGNEKEPTHCITD